MEFSQFLGVRFLFFLGLFRTTPSFTRPDRKPNVLFLELFSSVVINNIAKISETIELNSSQYVKN